MLRGCLATFTPKPISTARSPGSSRPIRACAGRARAGRNAAVCGAGRDGFAGLRLHRRPPAAFDRERARRSGAGSKRRSIRSITTTCGCARPAKLARAGLSGPKIRTLKAIAGAIHRGELDLTALNALPADEAHQRLTAIHGIGPWTADIYLLSCLGHADAWPAGDLALQEAARLLLRLPARPSSRDMGPLAESWRPWRGRRAPACCGPTIGSRSNAARGCAILPTKSKRGEHDGGGARWPAAGPAGRQAARRPGGVPACHGPTAAT